MEPKFPPPKPVFLLPGSSAIAPCAMISVHCSTVARRRGFQQHGSACGPVIVPVFKTGGWRAILSPVGSTPTRFRHLKPASLLKICTLVPLNVPGTVLAQGMIERRPVVALYVRRQQSDCRYSRFWIVRVGYNPIQNRRRRSLTTLVRQSTSRVEEGLCVLPESFPFGVYRQRLSSH